MNSRLVLWILLTVLSLASKAQEIKMYSGLLSETYYQGTKEITKAEVEKLLESDDHASMLWHKSKTQLDYAYVALGLTMGSAFVNYKVDSQNKTLPFIATMVFGVTTIVLEIKSKKNKKRAISKFNSKSHSFIIEPSESGIGLCFRW
jgi:hypothetical protein